MRRYVRAAIVPAAACLTALYQLSQSPTARAVGRVESAGFCFADLCLGIAIHGAIIIAKSPAPKP